PRWRATLTGLLAAALPVLAAAAPPEYPDADHLAVRPEMPDPLVMLDGSRVGSKDDWFSRRRPELKALFEHYMYGAEPGGPGAEVVEAKAKVEREDRSALGGKATLREVTVTFGPPDAPKIHLLLIVPNDRKGPAPIFLGLNFYGNHAVLNDPKVALPADWVPDRA